jgi:hypothetical protein
MSIVKPACRQAGLTPLFPRYYNSLSQVFNRTVSGRHAVTEIVGSGWGINETYLTAGETSGRYPNVLIQQGPQEAGKFLPPHAVVRQAHHFGSTEFILNAVEGS